MVSGYILVEGMRPSACLEGVPLTLTKIERYSVSNATPAQPPVWTTVEFEFPEEASEGVANALAEVIDEHGGWYSHFNVNGETFVIYARRIFRYPSGDNVGRAEAEEYGRAAGVPDAQLDWDEYE
ncbi:MAG: hypothetical protein ABSB24_09270 [Gaiellaceae bacterium]|jgi:hypothetical protein